MAANFGHIQQFLAKSKYGKHSLVHYPSVRWPGSILEFAWKSSSGETTYYKCNGCNSAKKHNQNLGSIPNITVRNGFLMTDPDFPKNDHFCNPKPSATVAAQQIDRNVREEIRTTGKRPRIAHNEMLAAVNEQYAHLNEAEREEISRSLPEFEQVARSYHRQRRVSVPQVDDPYAIPMELQKTHRGRFANPGDDNADELLVLHQNQAPHLPLIIFASQENLENLRNSEHVVCDGNFKYQPRRPYPFAQLYTVHGFIQGEAMPLVYAILPDKSRASYDILFNVLRTEITTRFPDIGQINGGAWHFDYELAAMESFEAIFPEANTVGCVFHYAKALNAKKDELGLKVAYQQNHAVQQWIRRFVALCLLPLNLVPVAADELINNPPNTGHFVTNLQLQQFAVYFRDFWRTANMIPKWNNYTNDGPRTTNNAEGFHNSLRHKFQHKHPDLAEFLVESQKWHNSFATRARNLLDGTVQARGRRPEDVQRDQRIGQAKGRLHRQMQAAAPAVLPVNQIIEYLDYVQRYLGQR